jgi:glycerol-3-phosphate acyltransferase PlsY
MLALELAAVVLLAYLLGSIPTSIILGKLFFHTDIREHGSRNAGATNAFRVFGWKVGSAAILVDAAKGLAAVLLGAMLVGENAPAFAAKLLAGLSAVGGHIFTVFAGFRGGKGVGTAAGMLIGIHPLALGIAVAAFGIVLVLSGYVSAGSLSGAVVFPVTVVILNATGTIPAPPLLVGFSLFMAAVIFFTHRSNIRRLVTGTENRFPAVMVFRKKR